MGKGGMPESVKGVMGWTLGVGIIAFILLIMVIIFGNLSGNVGFTQDSEATPVQAMTLANNSIVTLTGTSGKTNPSVSDVVVINATTGEVITSGNYTLTDTTITGASDMTLSYNGTGVNVSYVTAFDSQGQLDSESIILNYTTSATNTAAQFPTVGTIIGIAILLAILIALLVFAIRRMMGVAESTGGDSNASFGGDRGFG